jgi:isopentenyl-diphosphate delta-isomerase
MKESIILVDKAGLMTGTMDKLAAHKSGMLHRAFSIFIFNGKNELLLQQRSRHKYHSGGLWSNTCCSHPKPGEITKMAAERRLKEEMGLTCKLAEIFSFVYFVQLGNGMAEHEFDHVFLGFSESLPVLNDDEAVSYRYVNIENLLKDFVLNQDKYTEWLKICLDQVVQYLNISKFDAAWVG